MLCPPNHGACAILATLFFRGGRAAPTYMQREQEIPLPLVHESRMATHPNQSDMRALLIDYEGDHNRLV